MPLPELLVAGAGGHGVVIAEAAQLQGGWSDITLYDDDVDRPRNLLGFAFGGAMAALQARLRGPGIELVVGLGRNDLRIRLMEECLALGGKLATVIHPTAIVSPSASIGAGSVVLAGAILGSRAMVGVGCIVNTASVVEHDCLVGDGVHLAPRVVLGGGVRIGPRAWLGIGATVASGLIVSAGVHIQPGVAVNKSVP
jgi:sugar O-acyltransferase (sialic acid O-acetyltransferase NeuD family)